jgi:hypothetical protein
VLRSWISKSESFNENDDQNKALLRDFDGAGVGEHEEGTDELDDASVLCLSRKMIAASCWDGESESKLCMFNSVG